nr:hypothetical protein BaRGS_014328 [Batillaria attramentaria]
MSYRHFQGIDNIMEVECSGKSLDSSTDLLMVSLFSPHDDTVLASANLKKKECTTSHSFSLCIIDDIQVSARKIYLKPEVSCVLRSL